MKCRIKITHCGWSRVSPVSCLGRIYLNLSMEVKKLAKFTCSNLDRRSTPDLATVLLSKRLGLFPQSHTASFGNSNVQKQALVWDFIFLFPIFSKGKSLFPMNSGKQTYKSYLQRTNLQGSKFPFSLI